jgi:hypothetical protein
MATKTYAVENFFDIAFILIYLFLVYVLCKIIPVNN